MTTIYLAGPIDLISKFDGEADWRQEFQAALNIKEVNTVCFNPMNAFMSSQWGKLNIERNRYIEEVNRMALESAEIFVMYLPKYKSSVGTPIELDMAYRLAKKVYILTDIAPGTSVYLDNRIPLSNWFSWDPLNLDSRKDRMLDLAAHIGSSKSTLTTNPLMPVDQVNITVPKSTTSTIHTGVLPSTVTDTIKAEGKWEYRPSTTDTQLLFPWGNK